MVSDPIDLFIARWHGTERAERANKDLFLSELCDLLAVPRPDPAGPDSADNAYVFERAVPIHHADGRVTVGKIDLYRRDRFVLEAKQTAAASRPENQPAVDGELALDLGASSAAKRDPYGKAMLEARAQAERYARNLPDTEPPPPFVVVLDVGHSFEIFADFTQKGKAFLPFPDARSHRVLLTDLRDEKIRARLRAIWLDPASLDPAKTSAEVTRQAARHLAELAKSFEADAHEPRHVAAFLTRCLFCMFAEDVGLLPKDGFRQLLESLRPTPHGVAYKLETLFRELNTGTPFSTVLNVKLLHFNGGLFADSTALPVNGTQLGLLIKAAGLQWRDVEPAIFGTLLERALDPAERHKLGAHYTPRAYVERLVLPAVIDPLRAEWSNVLASAISQAEAGRTDRAQVDIFKFHRRLCSVRVLDPACGSGNFLYVTLAHFKMLEGEVLEAYERFGGGRRTERGPRGIGAETVDPHQFLGLEINPRAVAIAELVLWIGYLQWHYKNLGQIAPAEPVLRAFHNIEHRDAVLAYDGHPEVVTWQLAAAAPDSIPGLPPELARDTVKLAAEAQKNPLGPVTLWDRRSTKTDFATGREVPDESKTRPLHRYVNPKAAVWPACDYIVGNPPFLGSKMMRDDLGDCYTATLRAAYPELSETADFVMFWWHKAALLARSGLVKRFGFITTNSLRQTTNRRIVAAHLRPEKHDLLPPIALRFAIPDHPWVDTADGAAVRIAMTVGELVGSDPTGELVTVTGERPNRERLRELRARRDVLEEEAAPYGDERNDDGSLDVTLTRARGHVSPDLTVGNDLTACLSLRSNQELAFMGAKLVGDGFVVTAEQARHLGLGTTLGLEKHIKDFRNGRDLTEVPRDVLVIDLFGLGADEVRTRFPKVYQHLLITVKPRRDQNKRASYRENWWIFAEPRARFRASVAGLPRYIATSEVGKHRFFTFLDGRTFPDGALIVATLADAYFLGVLSSRIHVTFALAAGGRMGMGNDPRYQTTRCFDPFPFPIGTETQRQKIAKLAESLDAHRKRAQAEHGLGLTTIYNVLEKLRAGQSLTAKEKIVHDQALVSTLLLLHDDLDAAVAAAYGWPADLTDAEILANLVALNAARVKEEKLGKIRWLRPEFQAPAQNPLALTSAKKAAKPKPATPTARRSRGKTPWPEERPAQVEAVAVALAAASGPASAAELAAGFARGKKETVAEILSALVVIGRAQRAEKRGAFLPG